ncbi:MAG: Rpn family recombination-promoting nuclease/putative transposase [Alphaproteobacteria bacterium]|nr:Rpn family recombination-promoting nuclease/putative transposase [Alphaproteobacteria bacterium]
MPDPHDALFKQVFGDPRFAAQELREHLPAEVLAWLDLDRLQRVPGSFVRPDLAQRHSDVLLSVPLRGGGELLVYVLFEHQSWPDPWMPWRLLEYSVVIWDRWRTQHPETRTLPLIYPLVLYHGARRWTAPTDLSALIQVPEGARAAFEPLLPRFPHELLDLSQVSEQALRDGALRALVKLLFKHSGDAAFEGHLARWGEVFRRAATEGGLHALRWVFSYIVEVYQRPETVEALRTLAIEALDEDAQELIMTIAEQWRQEGLEQGLEQGLELGLEQGRVVQARELLLRLLERRFGALSEAVRERVAAAELPTLIAWTDGIFSAPDAETLTQI